MALKSPESRQVQGDAPFLRNGAASTKTDKLQVILLGVVMGERLVGGEPDHLICEHRSLAYRENAGLGPWIKCEVGGVPAGENVGGAERLKRRTHANESVV